MSLLKPTIRTVKERLDTDLLLPMPRPWALAVYSAPSFSGIPAYRWTIPFREMQRRGYKMDWAHASLMPTWEQENPGQSNVYDIFVIHHVIFDEDFAKRMRDAGKLLVGDMDDDYSDRTRGVNTDETLDKMWAQVRRNDAMTVSTPEVKDLIVEYADYPAERVFVCPNLMDLTIWQGWERAPELTIGLSGGDSHDKDWKVVPGAVSRILDEYPDVHFFLSGYSPAYLNELKDKYYHNVHINNAWVPYTEYPGVIAKMDIGLCPVDPGDAFNAKKSPIKALELMCSGGVPVCSDMNVYRDVITHGENGLLVEHSEEGFYWGIKEAIDQRERMVQAGSDYVKANWDVRKRYKEWRLAFEQIAQLPIRNTL